MQTLPLTDTQLTVLVDAGYPVNTTPDRLTPFQEEPKDPPFGAMATWHWDDREDMPRSPTITLEDGQKLLDLHTPEMTDDGFWELRITLWRISKTEAFVTEISVLAFSGEDFDLSPLLKQWAVLFGENGIAHSPSDFGHQLSQMIPRPIDKRCGS